MQTKTAVSCDQFKIETLNIIFHELEVMGATNKGYIGVSFECGQSYDIQVAYALRGCSMGQSYSYPRKLWGDVCFSMRLLGWLGHLNGWQNLVTLSDGIGFSSSRWTLHPYVIGDEWTPTLHRMLRRTEEVFLLMQQPLDPLASMLSLHGDCLYCGTSLIFRDGDDHLYCPECLV